MFELKYQNRIIGSGEEPLDQIMFNPRNWRIHPMNQQNAELIENSERLAVRLEKYADKDIVANCEGYGTLCEPYEFIGDVIEYHTSLMSRIKGE